MLFIVSSHCLWYKYMLAYDFLKHLLAHCVFHVSISLKSVMKGSCLEVVIRYCSNLWKLHFSSYFIIIYWCFIIYFFSSHPLSLSQKTIPWLVKIFLNLIFSIKCIATGWKSKHFSSKTIISLCSVILFTLMFWKWPPLRCSNP